tara:strand:+ start:887 stop:1054 length:168 start_codon:yes stop_codon:yes gene_type:complete
MLDSSWKVFLPYSEIGMSERIEFKDMHLSTIERLVRDVEMLKNVVNVRKRKRQKK